MRTLDKNLIVGLALLTSAASADASPRRSHGGLSFSITIGGPVVHRQKYRQVHDHVAVSRPRGCSPTQASNIARSYGIQFQTIYRNRNTMTVVGYRNGHSAKICFSRASDCRIIR